MTAIVAGVLFTIQGLLTRYILKGDRDAWAFSFYFSLVGAITSLPFLLLDFKVSSHISLWIVMLAVGALIVLQNFLNFKSANYLEASVQGSISKFRLLWVLLIGIVFLGESMTVLKVVGTLLTVLAGIVVYSKSEKKSSRNGLALAFSATIIYAIVIALYKLLFSDFSSTSLTFFIFAIPALINFCIMPGAFSRLKKMAKTQGREVFVATFFGGLANLAMNYALSLGEVSKVLVIIEAFLIIVLVGEHIFLKERTGLTKKLLAVIFATIGAVLIRLAG